MNEDERGITPREVTAITVEWRDVTTKYVGRAWRIALAHICDRFRKREWRLVDLPCGCQDVIDADGHVIDREHDHVVCDGLPKEGVREILAREAEEAEARAEAEERTP